MHQNTTSLNYTKSFNARVTRQINGKSLWFIDELCNDNKAVPMQRSKLA